MVLGSTTKLIATPINNPNAKDGTKKPIIGKSF